MKSTAVLQRPLQTQVNDCCASLILAAEVECGAFMSAAKQLFGEEMALRAGGLWVETLEADSSFTCQNNLLREVTTLAVSRLTDLVTGMRRTPDSTLRAVGKRANGSAPLN